MNAGMAEGDTAFVFTSKKPGRAYKSMVATAVKVMKKLIKCSKKQSEKKIFVEYSILQGRKKVNRNEKRTGRVYHSRFFLNVPKQIESEEL